MVKKTTKKRKEEKIVDLKEDLKKDNAKKQDIGSSDPSWYHYLIIIIGIFLTFFLIYYLSNLYLSKQVPDLPKNVGDLSREYSYATKIGSATYNIQLSLPVDKLELLNYSNDFSHFDLLNTINYTFSFDDYNSTDNAFVSYSAIKLRRFLSTIYFSKFKKESFKKTDEITCLNSTNSERVIVFKIGGNETGVFKDENGCMIFRSKSANEFPWLVDSFLVSILEDEKSFKGSL